MKDISRTIIFFGSGPVAYESLKFLIDIFDIEAVITKPKKSNFKETPMVEKLAMLNNLNLLFADSKKELNIIFKSTNFKSEIGILVDYGVIISQEVIDKFKLGIVNSHFSLLPEWRGADPITFSILSGQSKTGVSLMIIESKLDTGKIIAQKSLKLSLDETNVSLTKKLIDLSNQLLAHYIPLYLDGKIRPRQQSHPDRATYSKKITKLDGKIDWSQPADKIDRQIRAYQGWPKSYTKLKDKAVIITKAHTVPRQLDDRTAIECGDKNYLIIDELIPINGKKMSLKDFLNGLR